MVLLWNRVWGWTPPVFLGYYGQNIIPWPLSTIQGNITARCPGCNGYLYIYTLVSHIITLLQHHIIIFLTPHSHQCYCLTHNLVSPLLLGWIFTLSPASRL